MAETYTLQFDLATGLYVRRFDTLLEIIDFFSKTSELLPETDDRSGEIAKNRRTAEKLVSSFIGLDSSTRPPTQEEVSDVFIEHGGLDLRFIHDTPDFQFLITLADRHPKIVDEAASLLLGKPIEHPFGRAVMVAQHMVSSYLASDPIDRLDVDTDALKAVFSDLQAENIRLSEQLNLDIQKRDQDAINRWGGLLNVSRKRLGKMRAEQARFKQDMKRSLTEISQTKDAFEKYMEIQAPVDYWNNRADGLRAEAGVWLFLLVIALLLSFLGTGRFLIELLRGNITVDPNSSTGFLLLATIGTAVTIMFIGIRILLSRYSKLQAQADDSAERASMAQAYLALISKNAAGEEERALILNALFRPSEGGADGGGIPAASLPALIAAIVAQRGNS